MKSSLYLLLFLSAFFAVACSSPTPSPESEASTATVAPEPAATSPITKPTSTPTALPTIETPVEVKGCEDADYPDWETSAYVLPFPVGETYEMGLTNCSSSYHAKGRNDALAYDFVMPEGSLITASRAGTVIWVVENGKGREINNLVVVDHGDNTYAEYMHLEQDGALVEEGDFVEQGDDIGLSGRTGLAGYPHLHLIVVKDSPEWPYVGVPINFSNTTPNPHGLATDGTYTALPYK
ncbi:MAG TPA: hypothetical protein ENJ56_08720 [Anaerolineae bacterium]|nr:hypothetical protein [Anaerolineae bacterium]